MQVEYQFEGFETTPSLQSYMESHFHTLKRRLDTRYHTANVKLKGLVTARDQQGKATEYLAELFIKVPRTKNPYVVKKTSENFRSAMTETITAMEKLLRRDSDIKTRQRRVAKKSKGKKTVAEEELT